MRSIVLLLCTLVGLVALGSLTGCPDAGSAFVDDVDAQAPVPDAAADHESARIDAAVDAPPVDPDLADVPQVTGISPKSATVGAVGPTLIVTGKSFVPRSVVQLDGAVLATSFVSATELRATVPTSKLLAVAQLRVTVGTSPPGGGASSAITFDVVNPVPTLTAIASPVPAATLMGSMDTPLALSGTGFVLGAVVSFDGVDVPTTFKSPVSIEATLPAAKLAVAGSYDVRVKNPTPGGGPSSPIAFTVTNPSVLLGTVSPSFVDAGSPALTITLTGAGFLPVSQVSFNGVKLGAIGYVSSTRITVLVPVTSFATVGTFSVVVTNPAPGGGVSAPLPFEVHYPTPVISNASPGTVIVGAAPTAVTLTGTGFFPASAISFNNVSTATTYLSPTQLRATLTAAQLSVPGSIAIRVANPMPGGGTSAPVDFRVDNPAPTVASLTPANVLVGAGDTTLAIAGTGFLPTSQVRAGTGGLATRYISPTQLTATVPSAALTVPGAIAITVVNPGPGGGASNAVTLTVGCDDSGVEVQLGALNAPVSLASKLKSPTAPRQPRFLAAGVCPTTVDPATSQPYRAVVVQNATAAPATLAAWAVCAVTKDGGGVITSADDAFLTFYRGATIPLSNVDRQACTAVVSEGFAGAGAYDSPEANESTTCPGLTKANGGGISLGVCEKTVVFLQPYFHASSYLTPPATLKVSLQ